MARRAACLLPVLLACVTARHAPPTLDTSLDTLVASAEAKGSSIGILAVDVTTGEVLYAHRQRARGNSASTMKLASTAAALAAVGPDYQFHTPIGLQGRQTADFFDGDLVVSASGDPSFGSRRYFSTSQLSEHLATLLAARGVRRWRGSVRVIGADVLPADRLGPGWAWDDEANDFGGSAGPFVFHDNVARLVVHRRENKSLCGQPIARLDPSVSEVHIDVQATAPIVGQTPELSCVYGAEPTELHCTWPLPADSCAQSAAEWITVPDPRALFEATLDEALVGVGITHTHASPSLGNAPIQPLIEVVSPPLRELVYETNKSSLNLWAERIAMLAIRARTTTEGYVALKTAMAADHAARGIAPEDLSQVDGSGLSRYNLVSAFGLVQLLRSCLATPYESALIASLPIAGLDGTLRGHILTPPARVWAKSGTLTGQRAFAGFIVRPADRAHPTVVFALLFSNSLDGAPESSAFFDRAVEIMTSAPLAKAHP